MTPKESPLIYYAPVESGGLMDYAVEQILALQQIGVEVECLGTNQLRSALDAREYKGAFIELPEKKRGTSRLGRAWAMFKSYRQNAHLLAKAIRDRNSKRVLISTYAEYFAPFWVPQLKKLSDDGVHFGVVVHDPVRDLQHGPKWWHERSIRAAYSFVNVAYVHSDIVLNTYDPNQQLATNVIPHGVFEFPIPDRMVSKRVIRDKLGLPESGPVALSFGHIRDGKNLDLVVKSLNKLPEFHLLIAGREQSSAQKPVGFYQQLAVSYGVADRCVWVNEFIPQEDVWKYFAASDCLLLLYSNDFRSASGVLNTAAQFKKPIVASGGNGPLKSLVKKYQIGEWVEQVNSETIAKAARKVIDDSFESDWSQYRNENSWLTNARLVCKSMFGSKC